MPVIHLANDKRFDASTEQSVLDAAHAAGIVLEHSCRTGRCGSCKTKVLDGEALPFGDQSGLRAGEREAGWILTCASTAVTDLRLDTEDVAALANYPVKTLPCRIDTLDRVAPDVIRLTLRLPPKTVWRYLAGQYIDVIGQDGVRRSYSIANRSADDAKPELHIRKVDGGAMSDYWFGAAQANDLLRLEGPKGTFYLRDVSGLDLVFLATGTGIAPIKAMLADLASRPDESQPASVSLFWGGRCATDLYWAPLLSMPGLRYTPVLSRADSTWQGARGHVQDVLLAERHDLTRTAVYACGSEAMIEGARGALVQAGLPPKRYFSDAFVSSD